LPVPIGGSVWERHGGAVEPLDCDEKSNLAA